MIALKETMPLARSPGGLSGLPMDYLQATLPSQHLQAIKGKHEVVMAQRQMFVRATLQFEFRKDIFDA